MFSYVIPFHSDAARLRDTLSFFSQVLIRYPITEVLLCHNGSPLPSDEFAALESGLAPPYQLLHTDSQGIGAAYRMGIERARGKYCILSASDLPFGTSDLDSFLAQAEAGHLPEVAVGSKAHPGSQVEACPWIRRVASKVFYGWRRAILGIDVGDTQGTILVRTDLGRSLLSLCQSQGYFFSTELLFFAVHTGHVVVELAVTLTPTAAGVPSSVSVWRDGFSMGLDTLRLAYRASALRTDTRRRPP